MVELFGVAISVNARLGSTLKTLKQLPNARVINMAGCGHCLNLDAPERFRSELRQFLFDRPSPAATASTSG
jgi:pimeloyl-ACP methyl ester carboxylesterase